MMPPTPPDQAPALKEPAVGLQTLSGKAQKIHQVLPQTQCQQCGYHDCSGYAQALVAQKAPLDLCQPGGHEVYTKLATLFAQPVNLREVNITPAPQKLAVINEQECIGCTHCIRACPVDAIIGAAKHMHTVIRQECTGCELCLAPCPVDCIQMVPFAPTISTWKWTYPALEVKAAA